MTREIVPVPSGCGIAGILNESGSPFSGDLIVRAMARMRFRSNGLGGGFAGYGIYPAYADFYAFHIMFESEPAKSNVERMLNENCRVEKAEEIPTSPGALSADKPMLWRYFLLPKKKMEKRSPGLSQDDLIVKIVMDINTTIEGALVFSSGKNMGIFKAVGYPEDVAEFYCLGQYSGYLWTGHGRFPTNTTGWWGGAHPFGLLDWSVVHNGEISSYGINRRYLTNFGYRCTFQTDSEVITYLVDLLVRKHGLSLELAAKVLAPDFWQVIGTKSDPERSLDRMLRIVYSSALVNGPFSIIVGSSRAMVGLNDRIKLRPMTAARNGEWLYIASEEAAIRAVCPHPESISDASAGVPIIGRLKVGEEVPCQEAEAPLVTAKQSHSCQEEVLC